MCTISVHRTRSALTVTMNRDESRARGPEISPARFDRDVSLLGPRDSDRGGMWMAVNECGVVGCLLNAYFPEDRSRKGTAPTRGQIVPDLLRFGVFGDVRAELGREFNPSPYPSFTLLLCSMEKTFAQTWTGREWLPPLSTRDPWTMLVSSSWEAEAVTAWRRRAFEAWIAGGCPRRGHLPEFHLLHPQAEEAYSPLMDRALSATRSITQVALESGDSEAVMRYWPRETLPDGEPVVDTLPVHAAASQR